jgi:hypothetical protein
MDRDAGDERDPLHSIFNPASYGMLSTWSVLMSAIETLINFAGSWHGVNRLNDPNTNQWVESESTAVVTPVLSGRFIRVDYTWLYKGDPQEGSLLLGYDSNSRQNTAHWIDSWHMGELMMALHGSKESTGDIDVRGAYSAPPSPDWGWRIRIKIDNSAQLSILMFNISPEGQEYPAVEINYERDA